MVNPLIEREVQEFDFSSSAESQLLALLAGYEVKKERKDEDGRTN